ncbi:MAG: AEC family transporter [Clostridia bacterium]|nr:AEC family transporter [Clostridia bacterium]
MLDNFIYSVNTVMPIFIMVVIGIILKQIGFLNESFFAQSEKFVFRIALPSILFLEVAEAGSLAGMNIKLVAFTCLGLAAAMLVCSILVAIFVRDRAKCGAFVQGACRSNTAILGIPLATNMFGQIGSQTVAITMPLFVICLNVFSVIVLSAFAPQENKLTAKQMLGRIIKSIVTNPLVIAVVLAFPFLMFEWHLPLVAQKSVGYLSNTTFALALMSLGSNFNLKTLRGKLHYSLIAALTKTIILPAVVLFVGVLCGFRGVELGTIFIFFASPTAVSSYIMAKNMKSDDELAAQILLLATILCLFTLFGGVFLLKTLNLI